MNTIANKIDHTMLKPEATTETIRRYCKEAKEYGIASVCVNTNHVPLVAEELKDTDVKTCCVVGFPLGAMSTAAKAFEAKHAVEEGAEEVDMVLNIGAVKDGNYDFVKEDIAAVVEASKPAIVKVIIETCLLTDEEKRSRKRWKLRLCKRGYCSSCRSFQTGNCKSYYRNMSSYR